MKTRLMATGLLKHMQFNINRDNKFNHFDKNTKIIQEVKYKACGLRFASQLCVAVAIFDHRNEVMVVAEAQADRREATAGWAAFSPPTPLHFVQGRL